MFAQYKILAALSALSISFGLGWVQSTRHHESLAAKAAIVASEQARKQEQLNAQKQTKKLSDYATRLKREASAAADARSDLQRLRDSLTVARPNNSDACDVDRARADRLADLLGEGASLVEEGGRHVEQLRAEKSALVP